MNIVIFAGGVGTRLWPLSRKKSPKQFEKIVGDQSTLQLAVTRLQPAFLPEKIYVSTNVQYRSLIQEQLPQVPVENIIGEPEMRDVGPAVGLMAAILEKKDSDEPMAILWSDHLVPKEDLFRTILQSAEDLIRKEPDKIVFIAQKPRFASQNLGWIGFGEKEREHVGVTYYTLKGFKYRPDLDTAKKYFSDGKHSWNLGYWVTTPRFLFGLFKSFAPEIYKELKKIQKAYGTKEYEKVLNTVYPTLEKISFDNAVIEKMDFKNGLVVSVDLDWSDVGAWEALKEALQNSENDNVTRGNVIIEESNDSLVYNYNDKQLLITIDVDGLLVINTDDVTLVCRKDSVPKIKKLVESFAGTDHEHLT